MTALLSLHAIGGDKAEGVSAVAIAPAGGLYLGGFTDGVWDYLNCGECVDLWSQPWVARITADGELAWEQRVGSLGLFTKVEAIAVDGGGSVVTIDERSLPGHGIDIVDRLSRWSPDGAPSASKEFHVVESTLGLDEAGNVYLQGDTWSDAPTPDFGGGPLTQVSYDAMYVAKLGSSFEHVYSSAFITGDRSVTGALDAAGGRWLLMSYRAAFSLPFGTVPAPAEGHGLALVRVAPDTLAGQPQPQP